MTATDHHWPGQLVVVCLAPKGRLLGREFLEVQGRVLGCLSPCSGNYFVCSFAIYYWHGGQKPATFTLAGIIRG